MYYDLLPSKIIIRLPLGCRGPFGIAIDIATRYRKSRIKSIANRDIDSEPALYENGCMKSVHKKQEMDR
ncbi:MAG: hypothetical protein BECKG1743E_GA0114224_100903 [Candidatus Kentron sp. G]|nr:MAG: hypothetical protein BECKG1743E_GA0114224_100903 [Candidatus Kentron sp. G]